MTPMIDVIFLLLVFFLTTSSFQRIEAILPTGVSTSPTENASGAADLPADPSDDALEQVVIKLSGTGATRQVYMNDLPIKLEDLSQRLEAISSIKSDVPVVIDPAGEVPAKEAIEVYDAARRSSFSRVYFAVRPL